MHIIGSKTIILCKYYTMRFWSDTSMYALIRSSWNSCSQKCVPTVSHRPYCAPLFLDFTLSDMTVSCVIHLLEWRRCGDNGKCEISPVKCTASEKFTFTLFAQSLLFNSSLIKRASAMVSPTRMRSFSALIFTSCVVPTFAFVSAGRLRRRLKRRPRRRSRKRRRRR